MNPDLAELKWQIKKCEEFIALCERIKHLEQLQGGVLDAKQAKSEAVRKEALEQLQRADEVLERLEAGLAIKDRVISAFEQSQITEQIKTERIGISSLQLMIDDAIKQIEKIEDEKRRGASELDELYLKLEEAITVDGFDPNNTGQRLAELLKQKDALNEGKKAEVLTRSSADRGKGSQGPAALPPVSGVLLPEKEFYDALRADMRQAKTTIEIVSPSIVAQRARPMMAELAQLAGSGTNVIVYMRPAAEMPAREQADALSIIADAHNEKITVIQRSGLQYSAIIIDKHICWEGTINILGTSQVQGSMRRTAGDSSARKLRFFLFQD